MPTKTVSHSCSRARTLAITTAALLALSGCGGGDASNGKPLAQTPRISVGVIVATPEDIGLLTELPGRLEATRVSQVRARAAGILIKRMFQEGSDVKAGQQLFAIDPAPYAAASLSAEAALARATANATQARALAERYKPLVQENAVSQQEYVSAVASAKTADADIAVAQAALTTARINLSYASVTAPISGRIGRAMVTEGALVGQNDVTELAVIQQIDPMFVNFTQSATEVLQLRRAMEAGQFKRASDGRSTRVRILLEDGSEFAHAGKLLFSDLTVDASTGQLTLRAEIPNPEGKLLPGLYVRVRIEQAQAANAISVPQQAVTRTGQADTLMVVDAEGKLTVRQVEISAAQDNRWLVLSGLKAGEQVVVDGFQKMQTMTPGSLVKTVAWKAPTRKPDGPAAAAGATSASPGAKS
jgi:membrane fusion protein, multidrug efflux system